MIPLHRSLSSNAAPSTRRKFKRRISKETSSFRRYAVVFLCLSCFSVYTLSQRNNNTPTTTKSYSSHSLLRGMKKDTITQSFNEYSSLSDGSINHLIIVAGHSVLVGDGDLKNAGTDENLWYLLDYQRGKGLPQTIVAHIQRGIEEAYKDPNSLLLFSGGETRGSVGPIDEGGSYYRVADALQLWKGDVRSRTMTEEFATDSFQNLLFSLCRFNEIVGVYPDKISIVSYSFKRHRFVNMHARALQLLQHNKVVNYIGVDPPLITGFDYETASTSEKTNAASLFESDPYGCYSDVLQTKRRERNPFYRTPWYELTCPDMKDILHWCGPGLIPTTKVPWLNSS